jgi:sporulation protein YtfJ
MQTAMENIRDMVDVNTIVGDPVECPDGSVIVPISRVGFGFAAGGSEWRAGDEQNHRAADGGASVELPFGGGSGGGVSISPIAFLVVSNGTVNVVPLDHQAHIAERLIELVPRLVDQLQAMFRGRRTEPMPVQPANAPVGDINRMM